MKKITLFISMCLFMVANSQELLTNGDFEAGLAPWFIDGAGSVVGGEVYFSSTTDAGDPWATQLVHGSLSFTAGSEYTLSFSARADMARDVTVAIQNVGI
jgi:endoglucanase